MSIGIGGKVGKREAWMGVLFRHFDVVGYKERAV